MAEEKNFRTITAKVKNYFPPTGVQVD